MHTRVRILPQHEWGRLLDVAESPFARAQTLPDPLYATVLVAENELGEITGTWMLTSIMLLEGLWRREDCRGDAIGAKRLLFGMVGLLQDRQIKSAITVIQDPTVKELARKVGFVEVPGGGTLHTLTLRGSEDT